MYTLVNPSFIVLGLSGSKLYRRVCMRCANSVNLDQILHLQMPLLVRSTLFAKTQWQTDKYCSNLGLILIWWGFDRHSRVVRGLDWWRLRVYPINTHHQLKKTTSLITKQWIGILWWKAKGNNRRGLGPTFHSFSSTRVGSNSLIAPLAARLWNEHL